MRRILGRGGRDKFIRLKFGRRHNLPVVRLLIWFLLGFLFGGLAGLRAHVLRAAAALAEGIAHVRGKLDGIDCLLHALLAFRAADAADGNQRNDNRSQHARNRVKHDGVHMLRDDITDGRHGRGRRFRRRRGRHGGRRGRGRRFRRRLHVGQEDDVGIIRLIVARRILAGYLKLNLARDARFQIEHERPAFAGRQGGNGRNRRTRFFDGQGRRVRLADVFHLHGEADDRGFAVNGGGLRLRGHVEHQRLARVLRGDVQFGRRDGNGFARVARADNFGGNRAALHGRPFDRLLKRRARCQLHVGSQHRAVRQRGGQAGVAVAARIFERQRQVNFLAGINVIARVGRQLGLQPVLRQGDRLARQIGNGVGLAVAAGLIGHGRLAGQLAVAHGKTVLKRHLFADGQRRGGQLLIADALVADDDAAQLNVARVGKGILHADFLPLARAGRRDGIGRRQLRRGSLGLDGHRHSADNLIRTVSGIDVILNVILDFAFLNLVLRHVPRAGIGHALFALQAVIGAHQIAVGIIERNLLGHIRLAAVIDLDGDGNILFGNDRLRLAERGDADGVCLCQSESRNGEQKNQHHHSGGRAEPS